MSPFLSAALALVALAVVSAQTAPLDSPFISGDVVSFTVSVERRQYGVLDYIPVTYRITNVSKYPIYVPKGCEATPSRSAR